MAQTSATSGVGVKAQATRVVARAAEEEQRKERAAKEKAAKGSERTLLLNSSQCSKKH